MRVLGIETTCDETAAAIVQRGPDGAGEILSNEVMSQIAEHAAYGGVVPEIAARAHIDVLDRLVERALADAGLDISEIDGVAAAAGPGLIGSVIVGLTAGKALALAAGKPFVAVNHLEAHALTARLTDRVDFPYLLLLVSGGHTQLVSVRGVGDYERLGSTVDDAIGEVFDKVAKMLGLGYPGGPNVEREAIDGDPQRFDLPRPMSMRPKPDFSLSGLKTAVRLVPGRNHRCGGRPLARGVTCLSRSLWTPECVRRRRRRCGEWRHSPRARPLLCGSRHSVSDAAAQSLHRQWRDDRLGGH